MKHRSLYPLIVVLLCIAGYQHPLFAEETTPDPLSNFSSPEAVWGTGVEAVIEEGFRRYQKTFIIDGKFMNVRIPFAQDSERELLADSRWSFYDGGKGRVDELWQRIEESLASKKFAAYAAALNSGREQVIIFDMAAATWRISTELYDIARLKADAYHGLPHRPYVLHRGRGVEMRDVYNYLYCIEWLGLDCSGFVWQILSYIAAAGGADLETLAKRSMGAWANYRVMGSSVYDSVSYEFTPVDDKISALRPGDIIIFRHWSGVSSHAAIIQSIDYANGVIRYLQSTDEAPQNERGVHASTIRFNPANPTVSLKDLSLVWEQHRYPPFPGETASPFSDDGARYRAYPEQGAGKIVRMQSLQRIIRRLNAR
jgi:hypothetical protein